MPFAEIPPENLEHLSLFGYDLISDDGEFAWYSSPIGRMSVEKARPWIWVEDVADALQLGAVALVNSPDDK